MAVDDKSLFLDQAGDQTESLFTNDKIGMLITGLGLVPAGRFEQPSPLAQGYVTYGTDSGHQNQPGQPQQAFALYDA